ncbi:Glucosamine-6-phosphate deaminase 1 [compost metagenome]
MLIRCLPSSEAVSLELARTIAQALKPGARLAIPSGETPRRAYAILGDWVETGTISFAGTRLFALDEYRGLPPEHPESFATFFAEALLSRIDLPEGAFQIPRGDAADPEAETARYEAMIADGGLDIAFLGIGRNGHIAFNEPADRLTVRTHVATLAEMTRQGMPASIQHVKQGLTMGVGTICQAQKVVLAATGASKAQAIAQTAGAWVDPQCPASVLQVHPDAELLLDPEAAGLLS